MIGGRRWWLAWPAGIVCAGIVAGLVYLAVPAVPAVVSYGAGVLRQGAQGTDADAPTGKPLASIGTALTDDCVSLYPPSLWVQLAFDPHTVLSQDLTSPAAELTTAMARWHPAVRMTCAWRAGDGSTVRTSLIDLRVPESSRTPDGASGDAAQQAIAAALADLGFGCRLSGAGAALLTCTRASSGASDTEVIEGTVWLSTTETGWHPAGYSAGLVDRLWPTPAP